MIMYNYAMLGISHLSNKGCMIIIQLFRWDFIIQWWIISLTTEGDDPSSLDIYESSALLELYDHFGIWLSIYYNDTTIRGYYVIIPNVDIFIIILFGYHTFILMWKFVLIWDIMGNIPTGFVHNEVYWLHIAIV